MEIREKVRDFIKCNIITEEEEAVFSDTDNIFEIGLVNSLFAMKLLNYVESEFEFEVAYDDMEIENFSTVSNIIKFIEARRN